MNIIHRLQLGAMAALGCLVLAVSAPFAWRQVYPLDWYRVDEGMTRMEMVNLLGEPDEDNFEKGFLLWHHKDQQLFVFIDEEGNVSGVKRK